MLSGNSPCAILIFISRLQGLTELLLFSLSGHLSNGVIPSRIVWEWWAYVLLNDISYTFMFCVYCL